LTFYSNNHATPSCQHLKVNYLSMQLHPKELHYTQLIMQLPLIVIDNRTEPVIDN